MTDEDAVSPGPAPDPAAMRKQYRAEGLSESQLAATPVEQFALWFKDAAVEAHLFEPNAMVVSTADAEGRPAPARCC